MSSINIPAICFIAASGTGKTSLLEQLIPALQKRGLRVAAIKRSHHDFEIDQPGKDSFRLRAAGAKAVILASKYRKAAIFESADRAEPELDSLIALLDAKTIDLVVVEGFKHAPIPKIELHRKALANPLLHIKDPYTVAVASDVALDLAGLPCLDLNNAPAIAEFIATTLLNQPVEPPADLCSIEPQGLLTLEQALAHIKTAVQPVRQTRQVPLASALDRVVAEPVISGLNLPQDRQSAMDGYAFMASDLTPAGVDLVLAGTSSAGHPYADLLKSGQCIRIMTGAVVPEHADSVVMQEQVGINGKHIHIPGTVKTLNNIRQSGEDIKRDEILLNAGKQLTACDLGLLASAGVSEITVTRKLKIGFFSTGDELRPVATELATGQIHDSNRYILGGLLAESCHEVNDLGIVPDNPKTLEQHLLAAAGNHDVLISTGGASVGDADFVHEILSNHGTTQFWKLAIKPGKPLVFGSIKGSYFFGLPGNPLAVITTFQQLVKPALKMLMGAAALKPLRIRATCTNDLKKSPGRREFQRGILHQDENGEFRVASAGKQESHLLTVMSRANCYIVLAEECGPVTAGEQVWVEPFDTRI